MIAQTRSDATVPNATPHVRAWRWPGLAKVSRIHASVAESRALASTLAAVSQVATEILTVAIETGVTVRGTLNQALLTPSRALASHSVFFLVDGPGPLASVLELDGDCALEFARRVLGASTEPSSPCGLLPLERASLSYLALNCLRHLRTQAQCSEMHGATLVALADRKEQALAHLERNVPHLVIDVELQTSSARFQGRLWLPTTALKKHCTQTKATASAETVAALPLRAVRRVVSTAEAIRSVTVGDVLTLGLHRDAEARIVGDLELRARAFSVVGELRANVFTIFDFHHHASRSAHMNEQTAEGPDEIDEAPVGIEVELARIAMPLAALTGVGRGSVVPLHLSPVAPVTLRIEGRRFALAELVDIDGELGARILEIFR